MNRFQLCVLLTTVLIFPACAPPVDVDQAEIDQAEQNEIVKATPGVGRKGQSLKDKEGILVTPIKTFFSMQQQIAFDAQIRLAMQDYKLEKGQGPQSHEEFMDQIITARQIRLPELPDGHEYEFDVVNQELMVKRPKQ